LPPVVHPTSLPSRRDADVRPPAPYRLYRATVTRHSLLCRRDACEPCADHGLAFDHRTDVRLA
jgi:hypothetical protein